MKDRSFGQEKKPVEWVDPHWRGPSYKSQEISYDEMMWLLLEQSWAETEPQPLQTI